MKGVTNIYGTRLNMIGQGLFVILCRNRAQCLEHRMLFRAKGTFVVTGSRQYVDRLGLCGVTVLCNVTASVCFSAVSCVFRR